MSEPPPGYDDPSVIARHQLMLLVSKFEKDLLKIEKVAREHLSMESRIKEDVEQQFWHLRHTADELGVEYSRAVEKLIGIYRDFLNSPSDERLASVMRDLSHLKTLLETS